MAHNDDPITGQSEIRHASDSTGHRMSAGVARDLGELARQMQAEPSEETLLALITRAAVIEIEGADLAGISLIEHGNVSAKATTDPLVEAIDELQVEHGDGPCLSSLRREITVRSDDLGDEPRWPAFAAAAVEAGVRSMLSVQLFVQGDNLGALNLYSRKPHGFTDEDETTAMLLAVHAALAMKGRDVESNLRSALETRDRIGQAKGILMERYKINDIDAFHLLVLASQRAHVKLHQVADELAATGQLTGT